MVAAKANSLLLSSIPNTGMGNTFVFFDLHLEVRRQLNRRGAFRSLATLRVPLCPVTARAIHHSVVHMNAAMVSLCLGISRVWCTFSRVPACALS